MDARPPRPFTAQRRRSADAPAEVAAAVAAGVTVGLLLAGPLARLEMFILRRITPSTTGLVSDDGFVIGRFSLDTLAMVAQAGAVGGLAGLGYVGMRRLVPHRRVRLALWTTLGGATAGALFVHTDGRDFHALGPTWLAVGGFVLIPAVSALAIGALADRLDALPRDHRLRRMLPVVACAGVVVVPFAIAAAWLIRRREDLAATPRIALTLRIVGLGLLGALIVLGLADLATDVADLA